MGRHVQLQTFSRADRTRYRDKIRANLDALGRMLVGGDVRGRARPMTGLEIELNLVDAVGDPVMRNAAVLGEIADPDFVTELGQFNIEINVPPRELRGRRAQRLRVARSGPASTPPRRGPPPSARTSS